MTPANPYKIRARADNVHFLCFFTSQKSILGIGFNHRKARATNPNTTKQMNDYQIIHNGHNTYMVMDIKNNDCLFATNTERKAKNFLKRTLEMAGLLK